MLRAKPLPPWCSTRSGEPCPSALSRLLDLVTGERQCSATLQRLPADSSSLKTSASRLENVDLDMLGEAARVRVSKEKTTIVEGKGTKEAIEARINQIRRELEETDSDYDRESSQERLASSAGGVAVIKVGAASETELKDKKHRFEDALAATRAAVEEGMVPGGGVTYINVMSVIDGFGFGRRREGRCHDRQAGSRGTPSSDCRKRRA